MRSSSVSRSSSSLLPPPRQAPPRRCASPTRHFLLRDTFLRARNIAPRRKKWLVPSTQCPTNAQSVPDVGNIDVNLELPVNARIESRSLTLEANLGELQRLVKVQNSSGATPLIVTSGTTTAVTSFAGNNHSVGRLHACPDKGTTTTIGQRDQKNQTYIHLTNVADKGKGIIENDSRYMWNVIIPNSLGYDDDIVIDENLSTPPLVVGCRRMGLQSGTMMHWELGTPKLSLGGNISRPCIEQRSTDKIMQAFNDFPGFEQLDRTSVVCEVFSHSATPLCANKILKVE
ncbi:uncharacterized protein LOC107624545 [Arachis ipaensis]|uniref:uncharacterized protein LOC107624545 n=1 Tax=Arachis ipaensis TaxID=130454 RepID=UPI000A2AF951|nr:uncharacterized protein LOC107624545 [Arachis ipaensis]